MPALYLSNVYCSLLVNFKLQRSVWHHHFGTKLIPLVITAFPFITKKSERKMKTITEVMEELGDPQTPLSPKRIESALESFNITEVLASLPPSQETSEEKGTKAILNEEQYPLFEKFQSLLSSIISKD